MHAAEIAELRTALLRAQKQCEEHLTQLASLDTEREQAVALGNAGEERVKTLLAQKQDVVVQLEALRARQAQLAVQITFVERTSKEQLLLYQKQIDYL